MRHVSAACHRSHVGRFEPTISAERGEIPNRCSGSPLRIDEPVVRLDELALPDAVYVRPSLVRLQLADTLRQSVHGGKIQAITAAKIRQIDDRYEIACGVAKAGPGSPNPVARGRRLQLYVETDATVGTPRQLNPTLLSDEQSRRLHMFEDRERKGCFAVQVPCLLQVGIDVDAVAQIAAVRAPARTKIGGTTNINLAVLVAANLVDPGRIWNLFEVLPC
jgi:hypothetical protein